MRGRDALLISKVSQAWVLADLSRRKGDMGRLIFFIFNTNIRRFFPSLDGLADIFFC